MLRGFTLSIFFSITPNSRGQGIEHSEVWDPQWRNMLSLLGDIPPKGGQPMFISIYKTAQVPNYRPSFSQRFLRKSQCLLAMQGV